MISFQSYTLEILKKAQKSIDELHEPEHSKIVVKIQDKKLLLVILVDHRSQVYNRLRRMF